ncbi:Anti-proliferative protein domain-containing protein [Plasmodiophora brassicae]|uniref:Anti-proliferative protein domain-containing protein n=1 Tax=Plasmodiophora brassicae TaxID=37360 RepID=A0A0G4IGH9_PLABS|nr:hypothetical protein PBRA_000064 [Plasmodiophora brassicae]SPQ96636.1 unnamed protein product [Plasmodiophora brassicae]
MRTECEHAARWWTEQLRTVVTIPLPADAFDKYEAILCDELLARFKGHWHRNDRQLGSAYRSIAIDMSRVDPVLQAAAVRCGLGRQVLQCLASAMPNTFMFVNPNEVRVRRGAGAAVDIWRKEQEEGKAAPPTSSSKTMSSKPGHSTTATPTPSSRRRSCKRQARETQPPGIVMLAASTGQH